MDTHLKDAILIPVLIAIPIALFFAYYKVSRGTSLPSALAHALTLILRPIAFLGRFLRWFLRLAAVVVLGLVAFTDTTFADIFKDGTYLVLVIWIWFEITLYFTHLLIGLLIVNDVAAGAEQASMQEMQATITDLQNTIQNQQTREEK